MGKLEEDQRDILEDKIKGIIFGAALGDAVGLATEFMNKETAKNLYGKGPIKFGKSDGYKFYRDGHRRRWNENDFTDDTDQMLLILQCILNTKGILIPQHFAFRLKEWTNLGFPELSNKLACGVGFTVGSALSHPEFLTNPHKASYEVWDQKGRNLAANGAVMRTSILGVPFFWNEIQVVENAINCAKVTHADPRSVVSAVVASVIVSRVICNSIGITLPPTLTEEVKRGLIKLLEAGSNVQGLTEDVAEREECPVELEPKKRFEETPKGFFTTLWTKMKKLNNDEKASRFPLGWPEHEDPDPNRLKNPVVIKPENSPKSINTFGCDETFSHLLKQVVSDYKFLLSDSTTLREEGSEWIKELESHCFPGSLEDLKLDEPQKIGYTLKCLGSAVYCFTRCIPEELGTQKWFQNVITELTLEAGDADTNGAVAGALLGARLGLSKMPKEWVEGLRHYEFLDKLSMELENYEVDCLV